MSVKVSVIIPTKGRDQCLRQTLEDLNRQDYKNYNVWVIDQNEQPLGDLEKNIDPTKLVHENMPPLGSHAGRNRAIFKTDSEICIFVDDDVRVPINFISLHIKTIFELTKNHFHILAGKVIQPKDELSEEEMKIKFKPAKYNKVTGLVSGNFFGNYRCEVDHIHECNFSAPTAILKEVGGFNENFKGNAYFEGTDLSTRLKNKGYRILFCPEVSLIHLQDGLGGNREKSKSKHTYWYMRNLALLNSKHMNRIGLPILGLFSFSYVLAKSIKNRDFEIAREGFQGIWDGIKFFYERN